MTPRPPRIRCSHPPNNEREDPSRGVQRFRRFSPEWAILLAFLAPWRLVNFGLGYIQGFPTPVRKNIMPDLRSSTGKSGKREPLSSMRQLKGEAYSGLRKFVAQRG